MEYKDKKEVKVKNLKEAIELAKKHSKESKRNVILSIDFERKEDENEKDWYCKS